MDFFNGVNVVEVNEQDLPDNPRSTMSIASRLPDLDEVARRINPPQGTGTGGATAEDLKQQAEQEGTRAR